MTKKEKVLQYLKNLHESGGLSTAELLSLNLKNLKDVYVLAGIGKTTIKEALSQFKRGIDGGTSIPNDEGSFEPLLEFMQRLHAKDLSLFGMIEEWEHKKKIHETDPDETGMALIREKMLREFPVNVPRHDKGHGLGVRIEDDLFKEFQNTAKKTGLNQRKALHISLRMFVDYCEGL